MSKPLFSYRKFWAECFGTAPELPMSRAEMDALGWDSCDIIIVTGDAYVDHPSFGMAVIGRLLEAHYDFIHAVAWRWSGRADDADDITQDVCIKLAQAIRGNLNARIGALQDKLDELAADVYGALVDLRDGDTEAASRFKG